LGTPRSTPLNPSDARSWFHQLKLRTNAPSASQQKSRSFQVGLGGGDGGRRGKEYDDDYEDDDKDANDIDGNDDDDDDGDDDGKKKKSKF
jgi:hypothetical protein